MNKKYVVRLSDEERGVCQAILKHLKGSSQQFRRAQILLKADVAGPGWSDAKIAEAFRGYLEQRCCAYGLKAKTSRCGHRKRQSERNTLTSPNLGKEQGQDLRTGIIGVRHEWGNAVPIDTRVRGVVHIEVRLDD